MRRPRTRRAISAISARASHEGVPLRQEAHASASQDEVSDAEARDIKGADRKKFMNECLKK
jgi:hypothetical protein